MTHIESRPSKRAPGKEYDFYIDCTCTEQQKVLLVEEIQSMSSNVSVLSRDPKKDEGTCAC